MFIELSIYSPTSPHYGHGQNPISPLTRGEERKGGKRRGEDHSVHWSCKAYSLASDFIKTCVFEWEMDTEMQQTDKKEENPSFKIKYKHRREGECELTKLR